MLCFDSRHKTSHLVLSIIFLEDEHKILLHLSIFFMSINIFFNTVSVFRYSRLIIVTRDPDLRVEVGKHPQVILVMYFYLGQE
jgi:uncharacterized membrane protein YqjE